MEIILKDGVKYTRHYFDNENQFEKTALGQHKSIFGDNTILFDKQKIRTATGIGTIPDAFIISPENEKWYIIEVELASHDVYQHIIPQMIKFKNALDNVQNRRALTKAFDKAIEDDLNKQACWIAATNDKNVFRSLSEIIEKEPELLIIIDDPKKELENSINKLPFATRINVFKTFCREGFGFGDNIFLFDTFTTSKKIVIEKKIRPNENEQNAFIEREDKERLKAPSPSAKVWVQQIPELSDIDGLNNWTDICDHYKLHHKGNSARRVLQTWVQRNKYNWMPVPNA